MTFKAWLVAGALAAAAVFTAVGTVLAEGPTPGQGRATGTNKLPGDNSAVVTSGPTGVTISISISDLGSGSPGTDPTTEISDGPTEPACVATPMHIANDAPTWIHDGLHDNPGTVPWGVHCENGYFAVAWVPVDAPDAPQVILTDPGDEAIDPVALAASVLDSVPLPPIELGVSPGVGLVALPSWFWIEGYDGAPLRGVRTLGPVTVEVEIVPERFRWDFGDGSDPIETTSLGEPYPGESDIQHAYEQSSLSVGGAYTLHLEIVFQPRYRVNGEGWDSLPAITQSHTHVYPVNQLQSVITTN